MKDIHAKVLRTILDESAANPKIQAVLEEAAGETVILRSSDGKPEGIAIAPLITILISLAPFILKLFGANVPQDLMDLLKALLEKLNLGSNAQP